MALGGTVDVLATEDPDAIADDHEELQIYEKHNNLLHGSKRKKYVRSMSCPRVSCLYVRQARAMNATCLLLFQG